MPKTQIKCVLFDYGNVISLHQTLDAKRKQAALACLELSRFRKLWSQYRPSYDQGVIDGREYWAHILRHGRMDSEDARLDELIQADIESWRPVNEWVLEWAQTLRDSGMQPGILSNMPPELVVDTRTMPWIEGFQPLFFSAEIKANKPYEPIYRHVIDHLDCAAAETVFIDDREDNCRGARRSGLKVIHHRDRESTMTEVAEKFGLPD